MPDIGFGEIVAIVVVALLVFGPDRLPKVAADAARTLRQVRQMAASARKDLVDAAGLEDDGEMAQTVRDFRELDPRRAMQGVLTDDPTSSRPTPGTPAPGGPTPVGPAPDGPAAAERAPGAVGQRSTGAAGGSSAGGAASAGRRVPGSAAAPVAPPVVAPAPAPAPVDPDWT